jgi:hypothetical protein
MEKVGYNSRVVLDGCRIVLTEIFRRMSRYERRHDDVYIEGFSFY